MSATNETTNLKLPQFIGSDKPTWLGDVNGAFKKIDDFAGEVDSKIGDIDSPIEDLKNTVGHLQSEVTAQESTLELVNERLSACEVKNTQQGTKISKLETDYTGMDTALTGLSGRMDTVESSVAVNAQNILGLNSRVTTLEENIDIVDLAENQTPLRLVISNFFDGVYSSGANYFSINLYSGGSGEIPNLSGFTDKLKHMDGSYYTLADYKSVGFRFIPMLISAFFRKGGDYRYFQPINIGFLVENHIKKMLSNAFDGTGVSDTTDSISINSELVGSGSIATINLKLSGGTFKFEESGRYIDMEHPTISVVSGYPAGLDNIYIHMILLPFIK